MAKSRTDTESVIKLIIDGKQASTSVKELRDTYYKLNAEINNMKREDNPKLYAEKVANIQKVDKAWKEARMEMRGATKDTVSFKDQIVSLAKTAAGGILGTGAFYSFVNGAKMAIQKNAELSDSIAGVMKTTGLNEEAVDRLNEKFKAMDTRTANTQLLELAQVAGKLGYSAERDVEGFVRAADKIGVALGEDLGGVEESVNSLGKLVNIFKISDQFELEESLLKVGSAINTLGASGTANEKNLINFSQRLAGVAPAANISLPTVLAYGAVMDELGQSMESSSTAIGQFIVGMGTDVPKFAKIAGVSIEEFSNLMRDDVNEALLMVLENSQTAGGGIQQLAKNMGILEVSGARGIAAIGAMADNVNLVRERLKTSNEAFDEGTSVLEEFNTVNNNLAANLEKIWNNINELWENSHFRDWMTNLTSSILDNRTEFEKANNEYQRAKSEMTDMESKVLPLIDRYDELTKKGELNKDEHVELQRIINQLSQDWPIAVGELDNYGNAISINTDLLRGNIEEHQRYLSVVNKTAIQEGLLEKQRKEQYAERLRREIEEKRVTEYGGSGGTAGGAAVVFDRDLSNEELQEKKKILEQVDDEIFAIGKTLGMLGHRSTGNYVPREMEEYSAKILQNADSIESRIAELKTNLNSGVLSSQQFKETEVAIGALENRLKSLNKVTSTENNDTSKIKTDGAGSKKDREAEKQKRIEEQTKKHFERLLQEEEVFSVQQMINQKEKNEREIAQIEFGYQKKLDRYNEFIQMEGATNEQRKKALDKIANLEVERDNAVAELKVKQEEELVKKVGKIREELQTKMDTEFGKEVARINEQYDRLKKDVGTNVEQLAQIEENRVIALSEAKIREEERLYKIKQDLENKYDSFANDKWQSRINEVNLRYNREVELLKEKNSKEIQESEAFKEVLFAYETNKNRELQEIEEQRQNERKELAIDVAQSIASATFSIMSNNIQAESNARISAIERERETELSNKNLTEKQKEQIEKKYDRQVQAEKLRAWKAQKRADILSATINTALAVTRALPNWILAAAAGAAGAAQIAVISSQKEPQFAKGGFIPKGSSHAQGGIKLVDSRSQRIVGEVEGNEPILSTNTYQNNREIVDALLYSSQRKNGSRIQLRPDIIPAEQNIRTGGAPTPTSTVNVEVPHTDNSEVIALLKTIAANGEKQKNVIFSTRQFQDEEQQILDLQNRANA